MLVPLGWLQEFVQPKVDIEELAERLTLGGLEVKSIEDIGAKWDRKTIFVGEVVSVRQHPNADRLVLVTVEYGQDEPIEVVTGAPNLHIGDAGQKVVFATNGAHLIDGHSDTFRYITLKPSKIRGILSQGMVCSEKELGISDAHEGIIILPNDAPTGTPFADYWGDYVFDLDLTPNLARCFSIIGTAREAAALTDSPFNVPVPAVKIGGESIEGQINVEIQDPDLCPRYSVALVKNVKIGPSPEWMQRRLTMAGMRPINNVVDITNYVMLEWGQPLHAFDYRTLQSRADGNEPTITVRRAKQGEAMTTLDDVVRKFNDEMLLITDTEGPLAVAGVMGGLQSEISDDTVDVLIESANFEFISVRKTSAALKIPSESSIRFGRGVDPELTLPVLYYTSELMRLYASGTICSGVVDEYPGKKELLTIDLPKDEVKRLLGIVLETKTIAEMLVKLGFSCTIPSDDVVRVTVPSFRFDVTLKADLIEEVARMYGYDRLPSTLIDEELPIQRTNREIQVEERTRDILAGCGLTETISYSLTNLKSIAALDPKGPKPKAEDFIAVANPQTPEREFLRQTLMNTTLETVARNLRFVDRVAIYELAHVYLPRVDYHLPSEPTRISIALTGPREERSWLTTASKPVDFYDIKGVIETLCDHLGIEDAIYEPIDHPTLRPGRACSISIHGKQLGVAGELHPLVATAFDLGERRVCLAELDMSVLIEEAVLWPKTNDISPMPALKEDIAVVVDDDVPSDAIIRTIIETGGNLLVDAVLFDVYRGEQVGKGKKSLAYSLTFQSSDKTLTSKQTASARARILKKLASEYNAEMRG